jgi:hypothetical protein
MKEYLKMIKKEEILIITHFLITII